MDQQCSFTTLSVHENTGRTSEKDWRQIPRVSECWVKPLFIRNNVRYSGYLERKKHTNDLVQATNERQKLGLLYVCIPAPLFQRWSHSGKRWCCASFSYIDDDTQDRRTDECDIRANTRWHLSPGTQYLLLTQQSIRIKPLPASLWDFTSACYKRHWTYERLITHLSISAKHHLIP